jgi:hypothetical protein
MSQQKKRAQEQMQQQQPSGRSSTPLGSQGSGSGSVAAAAAAVTPSPHSSQSSRVIPVPSQQRQAKERSAQVSLFVPNSVVKVEERQKAAAALERAAAVEAETAAAAASTPIAGRPSSSLPPPPVHVSQLDASSSSVADLHAKAKAESEWDGRVEGACAAELAQSEAQLHADEQMWREAIAHRATLVRMQGDAQKMMDEDKVRHTDRASGGMTS